MRRLLLAAFLALGSFSVVAHQAPSGWEYSANCCSSADCAPVPDATIEEVQGGFSVVIPPGDHPAISQRAGTQPVRRFFYHGDHRIHPSGDGKKHACVGLTGAVYCIYVPVRRV